MRNLAPAELAARLADPARQGFARVHNLAGGVDAWARTVDPAMPVY